MKTFEAEIGEALFIRNGRSIELSARGKEIYERAQELFEIADAIEESLQYAKEERTAAFRIGVSSELERPFIAETVGKLLRTRRAQRVRFAIISKEHKDIAADFIAQRVELAITNSPIRDRRPAFEFDFPVFLATSQTQSAFQHLNAENLPAVFQALDEGLIAPSKDLLLREELDRLMQRLKVKTVPSIIFESNIIACTVRAIREKVGCGFVPLPYIHEDYKRGTVSIVGPKKGYWQHRVYFYATAKADPLIAKSLAQLISDTIVS